MSWCIINGPGRKSEVGRMLGAGYSLNSDQSRQQSLVPRVGHAEVRLMPG